MKAIISKLLVIVLFVAVSLNSVMARNIDPSDPGRVVPAEKFAYSLYAISETTKFRLAFENELGNNVTVKVFSPLGKLIYTDRIKQATELKRNYDLATMGRGVYSVEISNGEFKTVERVAVGGAKLNPTPFNAYISASLTNGMFKVAYQGGEEGTYITVRDSNGTLLYSEHNESDNFARKYNISSLKAGTYTVTVENDSKVLEQTFVIK